MASMREVAREVLDDAKSAINWIAFWKTGRSWHSEIFFGVEYDDGRSCWNPKPSTWKIDDEDADRLLQIYDEDSGAILVNAYYDNLGGLEDMTLESLIDGILFQYNNGGQIMDILQKAKEDAKCKA